MISSVLVEPWPLFSDHSLVTAITSYELGKPPQKEEIHLLDCGKILKNLNFNQVDWAEIKAELDKQGKHENSIHKNHSQSIT